MAQILYLFPKFLDVGSYGAAVNALHLILCMLGFGEESDNYKIERDGEYGMATVKAVKLLQAFLGFKGDEIDGNFGPKTRYMLFEKYKIDIDVMLFSSKYDNYTLWCSPDHEGAIKWDGERETT